MYQVFFAGVIVSMIGCKPSYLSNVRSSNCNLIDPSCKAAKSPDDGSESPPAGDFVNGVLSLSKDQIMSEDSATLIFEVEKLTSAISLQNLGVRFVSQTGSLGVVTYPDSLRAEAPYTAGPAGPEMVEVWVGTAKEPSMILRFNVSDILQRWRETLPVVFVTDQTLVTTTTMAPQVAMDGFGNALIAWEQNDGAYDQVYISEFRAGKWSHPASLADNIAPYGSNADDVQLAMNAAGDAVVVWTQFAEGFSRIFKSEYRAGRWNHPSDLSDNFSPGGQSAGYLQVEMDAAGDTLVVWRQSDGLNTQIFKSEYRSGNWSHPADLTDNISPNGQAADYPDVAMSPGGDAIIVWHQSDGTSTQIFKSEYRGGSWTHPTNLSDNISVDGQFASAPKVAIDPVGDGLIVWSQYDGANGQIYKSEYRSGSWVHPANLSDNISPDGQIANNPRVAMDPSGNALIVWTQSDGSRRQVFKSEYRSGSWVHPANLSDNISPDGQHANVPRPSMDENGNAIIVWNQHNGSRTQIFISEYRSGSWVHPADLNDHISSGGQGIFSQDIAMDNAGNALITWDQYVNEDDAQVFVSSYRSGSWSHPVDLDDNISPDGHVILDPHLAMNDSGVGVVVWTHSDGSNVQVFKSEYREGGWVHPAGLSDNISPNDEDASDPQVAVSPNGDALIVWRQWNAGQINIYLSEYRAGGWSHPSSIADYISPDGSSAGIPQVAIMPGQAIIAWSQLDGVNSQIFMSEYRAGTWTHPTGLGDNISPDGQMAVGPVVAMNTLGDTIISWAQFDGVEVQVFKSEFRAGSWTHPANLADNISPNGQHASSPRVALDAAGDALIVWQQLDGSYAQVFMSEYRSGSWTHPADLTSNISPNGQSAASPKVVMSDNGDAMIAWQQSDGANDQLFISEYRASSWVHPTSLDDNISPDGQSITTSRLAINSDGNACVVAGKQDGSLQTLAYFAGRWQTGQLTELPDQDSRVIDYSAAISQSRCLVAYGTRTSDPIEAGLRLVEFRFE